MAGSTYVSVEAVVETVVAKDSISVDREVVVLVDVAVEVVVSVMVVEAED